MNKCVSEQDPLICCDGCKKNFESCNSDTFTTDENNNFDWCAEYEGVNDE